MCKDQSSIYHTISKTNKNICLGKLYIKDTLNLSLMRGVEAEAAEMNGLRFLKGQ